MGGRPLLYIFSGSYTGMAPQLAALKNATQAAMGVEPYLVVMGGNAKVSPTHHAASVPASMLRRNPHF